VKNTRMLTEGTLMLAIFTVLLLLSLFVPMAMLVTQFFLILPFLLYSAKYPVKNAIILVIGSVLISLLMGIVLVPFAILFGTTGTVMGYCIRTGKSKIITYMASSMAFLVNIVLIFAVASTFFKLNFIDELVETARTSIDQYSNILIKLGQSPDPKLTEQMNEMISLMGTIAPTLLVGSAFITVILLMVVNFPIMKRLGYDVPRFQPFHSLKFPKSILWYYLIALVLSLAVNPDVGSYWYMVLINAAYILQTLLVIQGLAFIFYFCHYRKWPKAIPIILVFLTFLLPLLLSIVRMLGIIDIGFNLRQRLNKK
jgi:uncharacterized protein YybS (DUF2232 family)